MRTCVTISIIREVIGFSPGALQFGESFSKKKRATGYIGELSSHHLDAAIIQRPRMQNETLQEVLNQPVNFLSVLRKFRSINIYMYDRYAT